MVMPIEILEKTNIKQHQAMEGKINEIVDVVNDQGLETIKDTVNDVKVRVGVLETENDNQDAEISQLGTRVTAVESKNSTQDAQISEVTGRVTTAEGKITALENDKADTTDVTALANRVTAVEQKNTTQDTEISEVTGRMTTAETKITALENDKADTSDVTALANRVTAVEQKNTAQDSQISEVTGRMTTAETKITALENDKADSSDVTALGNRVTAVEQKNTTQDTEISKLGTRVTAIEGEMPDISYSGPFLSDFIIRMIGNNEPEMRFTTKTLNGATSALTQDIPKAQNNVYGVVRLGDLVVKNQGTANAGKALVVGSDGMVAPGDVGGGGGGSDITTFQFNGPNFDDFKKWVTSTAPYKQFSGRFDGGNGFHGVDATIGGSGLRLFGGGLYSRSSPDGPIGDYPISQCRFELINNDNIRVTVFYADENGASSSIDFNVDRMMSSFVGSAFVIN